MRKRKVLITGAAGFVGTQMVKTLIAKEEFGLIVGIDIKDKHAQSDNDKFIYLKNDIRDKHLADLLTKYEIDTVVHLATIVTPTKEMSREFLYSVDVDGTRNILDCCVKANTDRVVIASSGASYGFHADNPEWIVEEDQLRGNKEFAYSDHKRIVEEMLSDYRQKYPQLAQLVFRPCTVLGKTVDNQITDLFKKKVIFGIQGSPTPFVFIWDEDFIEAMIKGIVEEKEGIYNVAGDGALTLKEIAGIMKKPYISIPYPAIYGAISALKLFKLTQYGPEQVDFLRYRPVLLNKALKEKFGYTPKKTTRESFLCYLKAKNMY